MFGSPQPPKSVCDKDRTDTAKYDNDDLRTVREFAHVVQVTLEPVTKRSL